MKFSLFIGLCMTMLVYSTHCHAQSLYAAAINASNNFVFGQIDPATCVFCAEMSVPATTIPTGMVSLNALPNGQVAVIDGGGAVLLFDPFTLTYSTPFGGAMTQTFNLGIGAFQVCPPANAAPGPLIVQATKLVDNWCTCE